MIEKLVVVGWLALGLLVGTGVSGYLLGDGEQGINLHLGVALLTGGAFLLAYAGLAVYLVGTALLVRRIVRREGIDPRWAREHRLVWAPSLLAIALALVTLSLGFASGFPTYLGAWEPWIHHLLFPTALAAQLPALLLLRSRVSLGEAHLRALDRHLQGAALL